MTTPIVKGEGFTLIGYLEYDNYVIMNPEMDETGRFPVNPVTYYNLIGQSTKDGKQFYFTTIELWEEFMKERKN